MARYTGIYYNGKPLTYTYVSNDSVFLDGRTSYYYLFYKTTPTQVQVDIAGKYSSNVTNMGYMFNYCSSLTSLDLSSFDTSKVTYMQAMFNNCTSLTSLDLSSFDTANVTNMFTMFYRCSSLTSLDLSSFDTANVTNMNSMFNNCSSLTNLKAGVANTCKQSFSLSNSSKLTNTSVISVLNWLYDYSSGSSHTLTLNSTTKTNIASVYVKLVDTLYEECESTDTDAILLTTAINNKNRTIA